MSSQSYVLVANWKIYFSYTQALAWCKEHKNELQELTQKNPFILCPSFESLDAIAKLVAKSAVSVGAQNCSEHSQGAYTGQVSAQSLSELGAHYCIIGHSEVRKACNENNEQLLYKLQQLLLHTMIPIFCIGETQEEYEQKRTAERINTQLEPLIILLKNSTKPFTCFIAYEPIWAIGTGVVADNGHITASLNHIKETLKPYKGSNTLHLLYGGTVTSQTTPELKKVNLIEGFLLGKASTNFQELKKIVSLLQER